MERSPRNKMIKPEQEETKQRKRAARKRRFFFPHQQRSVEAADREEAEKLINKETDN